MEFDLNYSVTGQGTPFVFQHGLGSSLEQAETLLGGIGQFQLISIDSNGHGKSILRPTITPSFNLYANNVIRLLDTLKIEKAFFGGISMGSGIALNIALRFPDRVKGLVLVRPAWLDQVSPKNLRILLKVADYLDANKSAEGFKVDPAFQAFQAQSEGASQSVLRMFSREQGEHTAKVLRSMVNDRPLEHLYDLTKINQPCLVIGSDNDPLHPFVMADAIHALLPNSVLYKVIARYLDDAEHRRVVRGYVEAFLAKHG